MAFSPATNSVTELVTVTRVAEADEILDHGRMTAGLGHDESAHMGGGAVLLRVET